MDLPGKHWIYLYTYIYIYAYINDNNHSNSNNSNHNNNNKKGTQGVSTWDLNIKTDHVTGVCVDELNQLILADEFFWGFINHEIWI